MRVVLDSNLVVSALIAPLGAPARVVDAAIAGRVELLLSPAWEAELAEVLARPRMRRWFSQEQAARLMSELRAAGTRIDPPPSGRVLADPDDDYLVALARAGGAQAIVSGDRHLLDFPGPPRAVTPRELLDTLG